MISHEIKQKCANFSLKITKIGEIVICRFHGSRKWWNMKSLSCSINVSFYHYQSLNTTIIFTYLSTFRHCFCYKVPSKKSNRPSEWTFKRNLPNWLHILYDDDDYISQHERGYLILLRAAPLLTTCRNPQLGLYTERELSKNAKNFFKGTS